MIRASRHAFNVQRNPFAGDPARSESFGVTGSVGHQGGRSPGVFLGSRPGDVVEVDAASEEQHRRRDRPDVAMPCFGFGAGEDQRGSVTMGGESIEPWGLGGVSPRFRPKSDQHVAQGYTLIGDMGDRSR